MIIDDFRVSNEVLGNYFVKSEFDVYTCELPEKAVKILESLDVDLVITDYEMPQMNGVELMVKIRSLPNKSRLPVIILSANKNPEIKQLAFKENVTAWIEKPIDQAKIEKICHFLNS